MIRADISKKRKIMTVSKRGGLSSPAMNQAPQPTPRTRRADL